MVKKFNQDECGASLEQLKEQREEYEEEVC